MSAPAKTWKKVSARTVPSGVLAMDLHPSGNEVYVACMDRVVWAVPLAGGGEPRRIAAHDSWASGVRYIPGLDQVVSAGYDGNLRWSTRDGKPVRTVKAHGFWSWKMRVSPDGKRVASCTGQYLAGGEKYEPAAGKEPGVKVFDTATGELIRAFEHVPPVQSVAFSPDSRHVAAANLMGEIRIWDIESGKLVAGWTVNDFTCWGIIKSHHYIGGIYDLEFAPGTNELLACGMGPMVDPMAGDGKQIWQRWAWADGKPVKKGEIKEADAGGGLMESLALHGGNGLFTMAGRLVKGKWNAALFDQNTGEMLGQADTRFRVTDSTWFANGSQVLLAGLWTQPSKRVNGKFPDFGHLAVFAVE
ncbi:MAG: WD40 repeat domain-containing protein [Armatimonadaceae bacterium]